MTTGEKHRVGRTVCKVFSPYSVILGDEIVYAGGADIGDLTVTRVAAKSDIVLLAVGVVEPIAKIKGSVRAGSFGLETVFSARGLKKLSAAGRRRKLGKKI